MMKFSPAVEPNFCRRPGKTCCFGADISKLGKEVMKMFARVNILQGPPDRVEDGIRDVRERILPAAKQMEGYQGILLLVDRSTGKAMGITLWETEEARKASEEAADRLRGESAQAAGAQAVDVQRYEVVLNELTS
jgi:heme-degrading monooxygenase HmoA